MFSITAYRDGTIIGTTCQYHNVAGAAHEARFSWPGATYHVYDDDFNGSYYCGELRNEEGCDVIYE